MRDMQYVDGFHSALVVGVHASYLLLRSEFKSRSNLPPVMLFGKKGKYVSGNEAPLSKPIGTLQCEGSFFL